MSIFCPLFRNFFNIAKAIDFQTEKMQRDMVLGRENASNPQQSEDNSGMPPRFPKHLQDDSERLQDGPEASQESSEMGCSNIPDYSF